MPYIFKFSNKAEKEFLKLNKTLQIKILEKLRHFEGLENIYGVAKKLTTFDEGEFRLRVGDYRLIIDISGNNVEVNKVEHRKDVYK